MCFLLALPNRIGFGVRPALIRVERVLHGSPFWPWGFSPGALKAYISVCDQQGSESHGHHTWAHKCLGCLVLALLTCIYVGVRLALAWAARGSRGSPQGPCWFSADRSKGFRCVACIYKYIYIYIYRERERERYKYIDMEMLLYCDACFTLAPRM